MVHKDKTDNQMAFDFPKTACGPTLPKSLHRQASQIPVKKVAEHGQGEDNFRAIFDNAVVGLFQATPEGRLTGVNMAFVKMFGYVSPADMLRDVTNPARQLFIHPEQYSDILETMKDLGTVQEREIECRMKDGRIAWVSISGSAVRNETGQVVCYEGIVQNITRYKSLESQLHQSHKMEAIGTLAGGIAHDFNNILGAIIGYAEMALREQTESKRLRRYIGEIHKAGLRSRDLVQQILTFSRQSDSKRYPLRISVIVEEVMKFLRASLPAGIAIRQRINSDPDTVLADPTHIHQIIMNLCTNAAQAMTAGKGDLGISLEPVDIQSDSKLIHHGLIPGRHVRLTVSDTGQGIDADIIHKIFDPFFTTKKPGDGTGMGLAVVHGIVKNYGGAITVQSEKGKGTIFDVYFPLLEESEGQPHREDSEHLIGGSERILFVDDDASLVELGESMLTELGYKVTGRTSSLEALELFRNRSEQFDLIITDMTMPNKNGLELAREIRRISPTIPVILCTGFSELVTEERLKRLGVKGFIMKPIVLKQLASAVRQALDRPEILLVNRK